MHERPAGLADADVAGALRQYWQIDVADLRYAPVGYGGYHWTAVDDAGTQWFVTASRLTGPADLADLDAAMHTARDLADAGLSFVVAPARAARGDVVIRAWPDYAVSVFPFIAGVPGQWGDTFSAPDRAAMTVMLAELHTAGTAASPVPVRDLSPRSRTHLEISLRERGRPWRGGPYAEPARALVSEQAAGLENALAVFDDLIAGSHRRRRAGAHAWRAASGQRDPARRGPLLIDWDTVGLAPPERDLWWIIEGAGAEADRYAALTGCEVSQPALALYRLRWDLDDVGLLLGDFRRAHERTRTPRSAGTGLWGRWNGWLPPPGAGSWCLRNDWLRRGRSPRREVE